MLGGIHQALSQLQTPVVWTLTAEDEKVLREHHLGIPKHVHVVRFAPQNDLLGHPAVRAFVTQGGSNSFYEVCLAFVSAARRSALNGILAC